MKVHASSIPSAPFPGSLFLLFGEVGKAEAKKKEEGSFCASYLQPHVVSGLWLALCSQSELTVLRALSWIQTSIGYSHQLIIAVLLLPV